MYSRKIQKNAQKNILTNLQTKNSLDFSGLFLGPEKRRKLEKNSRGKKNSVKKYWFFSRKKPPEKFTAKNYRKKNSVNFSVFSLAFWPFLAIF